MLTISKPLPQARHRPTTRRSSLRRNRTIGRSVASSAANGKPSGRQFALSGRSLRGLCETQPGQHPQTGEQLVRQRASYEYQDPTVKPSRRWNTSRLGCDLFRAQIGPRSPRLWR